MSNSLVPTSQTGSLSPRVVIGQTVIPITGFSIMGGCTGTIGHAEITTTRKQLLANGIDLIALSSASPGNLPVTISMVQNTATSLVDAALSGNPSSLINAALGNTSSQSYAPNLFGGEYVSTVWSYDKDEVIIHCRDYAGVLVDQKRILSSVASGVTGVLAPGLNPKSTGVLTVGQTITSIISAIAEQFNFTPSVILQKSVASNPPIIGSQYGNDDQTYDPIPQSMWSVLNRLALDLGYIVFVFPPVATTSSSDGSSGKPHLYFGVIPTASPGTGVALPTINLSYNIFPVQAGAIPCKDLKVTHNPRRNETFRILVISYDPGKGQQTLGRATAIGSNFTVGDQIISPGIWTGTDAVTIDTELVNANNTPIPVYTFHVDGLNQNQAQLRAVAIAGDIQKRSLTLEATTDGLINIYPGQAVSIIGTTPPQAQGSEISLSSVISSVSPLPLPTDRTIDTQLVGDNKFHVAEYHHNFVMPQKAGDKDGGFTTTIKALNIATEGTGNPMKPLKQQNARK